MGNPCLRYVDAIPIEDKGEKLVILRDPDGLFEQPLVIAMPTFMIMSFFDGSRDLTAIQAEIQSNFDQLLPLEQLEGLVNQLDEFYLLRNDRSEARYIEIREAYEALAVRPAAHAGSAYPAAADELTAEFDRFFEEAERGETDEAAAKASKMPTGLIVPHIDPRRGGACMAHAYRSLLGTDPPEVYIILGVAHHPTENLYSLAEKDFDTPLGVVPVDQEIIGELKKIYGADRLAGEYAHKVEHSVEFSAVFLKYLHRAGHKFTIVPILCGSIEEQLQSEEEKAPLERPVVGEFCDGLKKVIAASDKRICIISSVDLSHVGKKFGDERGVDELRAETIRSADLKMLELAAMREPEAFFDHFRPDQNARNVDAVTSVYTMLQVLDGEGGAVLLNYDQALESETESVVTFASMALY